MTDYISTFIDVSRLVFWGRGALDVLGSQQDRPSHTCERHLSRQLRCHSRCYCSQPCIDCLFVSSLKCALALLFSRESQLHFKQKEETRWLPTTNQLTPCDAATSRLRSGRILAKRDRSSQRRGAMGRLEPMRVEEFRRTPLVLRQAVPF